MALLSINVYGENDEVLKTFETNKIRWRLFGEAVKINDEIKEQDTAAQMEVVGNFVLSLFPGMTADDLELCDVGDIFNTFKMVTTLANNIEGSGKNA